MRDTLNSVEKVFLKSQSTKVICDLYAVESRPSISRSAVAPRRDY